MEIVRDFLEIQQAVTWVRNHKKGYLTNFFPDKGKVTLWIDGKSLFKVDIGETVFFIKRDSSFYNLFFFSTNTTDLSYSLKKLITNEPDMILVSDLVGNQSVFEIKAVFEGNGFRQYTDLIRMSRLLKENQEELAEPEGVSEGRLDQADEILRLFNIFFDPKAEQLPLKDEIVGWIKSGNILTYEVNDQIVGFIIYDLNGVTLYLRYWFVHPDFREQKIGSTLFKKFLYKGRATKRQLFWVISSNQNAIKRYKHYGFNEEKMYNLVMINRDLKYGNLE